MHFREAENEPQSKPLRNRKEYNNSEGRDQWNKQ